MGQTELTINNCNNIIEGKIVINERKLNILFGRNGTGKSTIARAIYLYSEGEKLDELSPYGGIDKEAIPNIEGIPLEKVAIFDDNYVEQYIYQADTLIKDTFEVLIRSDEYDKAKKKIDDSLETIKATITKNEKVITLQQQIGILIKNIEFTGNSSKISKRKGGIKGVLNGKGAYFNPPSELDELKPFFQDDTVARWADWRLKGFNDFGTKGRCPYCSTIANESTAKIDKAFSESFDKASIEYASEISKALSTLDEYINTEKSSELLSLFGVKDDMPVLEAQLTKLGAESRYLHDRLTAIISFNGSSVERDNIGELEDTLKNMKIDLRVCDTYFITEQVKMIIDPINNELKLLLKKVSDLKAEIGIYNKSIQNKIKLRKNDINDFLQLAGFKYTFDVEVNGENSARALLKYILPNGEPTGVQSPDKHLSWGEKHSFALILFMFDAIRNDAKLIILDDPISSFDSNKKYAIINRLFKTGEKGNSLYERTVLMLTHDFEPVIDYVQTTSGRQNPTSVCATYFENVGGKLKCTPIIKNEDIMSSVVLFKELSQDTDIDIAARIGCLRKYIEHQFKNPKIESNAYNILSSLIHGRQQPSSDSNGEFLLTDEQVKNGCSYISNYIENFDYSSMKNELSPKKLLDRFTSEPSAYIKMLILRAYTEQKPDARERLRKQNDVLRKYIDETYHIENDYIYALDVRRFNIVPENYVNDSIVFVENELVLMQQ